MSLSLYVYIYIFYRYVHMWMATSVDSTIVKKIIQLRSAYWSDLIGFFW